MVEAELRLFEMKLKLVLPHAVELRQAVLGVAPEGLNAVDESGSSGELVVAMVDPKVLCQAQINQPAVAWPAIGVDDAAGVSFALDDGLQRGSGGIGDDFGIDTLPSLEQAKTMVLPPAPRPRLPRMRLGSK